LDGRIFALDQQTLISIAIQLLNACVLAVVLTYLLYKPVRKFLKQRADGIKSQLDRAQDDAEAAEKLKAFYDQRLEEIELERAGILEEAQRHAAEKAQRMLGDADGEIAAKKERAAADIQARRERANEENRLQIIETASAMAGRIVASSLDGDTHDRLFDETLAALEEAL